MKNVLDINKGKRKAKTRFILHIIFVVLLTAGVITGSILSLLFSSLDYIPNLVINIVLDALLVIFLIFYFLNIFPVVNYYRRFYKGMSNLTMEHRRKMLYVGEKGIRTLNNVNFKVLLFSYKEGENEYEEHLYVLDSDVKFEEHAPYAIDTYQNVIVRYQEIGHAAI